MNNNKNLKFLSDLSLKKKNFYNKKVVKSINKLKLFLTEKQKYNHLNFLAEEKLKNNTKNGSIVVYIIYISFSLVNTLLYVTDALGKLKFRYSAGLVNFKGKQKKNRLQVLNQFFKELKKLKMSFLKNKPVALHFNNVGFHKYFIIKNLKKDFFIRFVKNYNTYSYNGCRKKKKLRK